MPLYPLFFHVHALAFHCFFVLVILNEEGYNIYYIICVICSTYDLRWREAIDELNDQLLLEDHTIDVDPDDSQALQPVSLNLYCLQFSFHFVFKALTYIAFYLRFISFSFHYHHHYHQSSIINHQSSIINHQSSIINHQSSIINHQSSIINHQSSIINHQSSIINHHHLEAHYLHSLHKQAYERRYSTGRTSTCATWTSSATWWTATTTWRTLRSAWM